MSSGLLQLSKQEEKVSSVMELTAVEIVDEDADAVAVGYDIEL